MNKINQYIFKITNKYLLINLLIILSLVSFINLIEIARNLTSENQSILNYFLLSVYKIPSIINQILPFVIITSISFLFRYLINNNELISMRNVGHSIIDVYKPIGLAILLIGLLILIVINPISAKFEQIFNDKTSKDFSDMY